MNLTRIIGLILIVAGIAALGMGITPIARVTSHDPHDATRILDCGAQGVMVPHVQNAAEARAIVEACLYAPKGHRSAFGSGPQLGYAAIPQAEVCKVLNEETLLLAMIETPKAVENADAITRMVGSKMQCHRSGSPSLAGRWRRSSGTCRCGRRTRSFWRGSRCVYQVGRASSRTQPELRCGLALERLA